MIWCQKTCQSRGRQEGVEEEYEEAEAQEAHLGVEVQEEALLEEGVEHHSEVEEEEEEAEEAGRKKKFVSLHFIARIVNNVGQFKFC